jgi:hypothetical protein
MQVIRSDARRNAADPRVKFRVDPDAEPGNAAPALARLLIGIDRRRRERAAAELAGKQATQTETQSKNP